MRKCGCSRRKNLGAITGVTKGRDWAQISHEGRDPCINKLRAKAKKEGLRVVSGSMGPQVTPVGLVRLNMMTIMGDIDKVDDVLNECRDADVFKGRY